jgi:serine/threonine protein kinase
MARTASERTAAVVGKYQIFATLGKGGMAEVYLAILRGPLGFNKLAVIKRLRPHMAEDPSILGMFLDEARLAARLSHPNVIHTYDVAESNGAYFIAMEYLEGQPLNRVLVDLSRAGRPLPLPMGVRIIGDALQGLHYAHELTDYDGKPLEIVHRDVSPHNIFVTYDGQVKLVDFGIAKARLSRTHTEVGVLKGKVAYMSPEQALGEPVDRRADLFSMGAVLWEMITGRRLFGADSATATLHRLLNDPVPPPSAVGPCDPQLEAIVVKALAKAAGDRFRSAAEMRDALEGWLQARGHVVRQADIGQLLGDAFREVRAQVQRQIQQQMAAAQQDASDSSSLPSLRGLADAWESGSARLPAIEVDADGGSGKRDRDGGRREGPGRSGAPAATVAPPARKRRTPMIAMGLSVVGGAVLAILWHRLGRHERPTETATDDVAPARASAAVPSTDPPAASPTATAAATTPILPAPSPNAMLTTANATQPKVVPPPARRPRGSPRPEPPQGKPAEPPAPSAAPAVTEPGYLTLDTYPWTHVSEGGRPLGDTPLLHVALPPGTHELKLDNPDKGIHRTYVVTIHSHETVSQRLGLE